MARVIKAVPNSGFRTLQAKKGEVTMTLLVVYEGRRKREEEKNEG